MDEGTETDYWPGLKLAQVEPHKKQGGFSSHSVFQACKLVDLPSYQFGRGRCTTGLVS